MFQINFGKKIPAKLKNFSLKNKCQLNLKGCLDLGLLRVINDNLAFLGSCYKYPVLVTRIINEISTVALALDLTLKQEEYYKPESYHNMYDHWSRKEKIMNCE